MSVNHTAFILYGLEIKGDYLDEEQRDDTNKFLEERFGTFPGNGCALVSIEEVGNYYRVGGLFNVLCTYMNTSCDLIEKIDPPAYAGGDDKALREAAKLLGLKTTTEVPQWHLGVIIS